MPSAVGSAIIGRMRRVAVGERRAGRVHTMPRLVQNRRALVRCLCVVVLLATTTIAQAQRYQKLSRSDLKTLQKSFAGIAEEVRASVVAIRTYRGMRALYSQGSGMVFRSNGYILTNYHVIEGATRIRVVLHNGIEYAASVMQRDERSDLAVIKIEEQGLQAAPFGDLNNVRVGHWTFAVGNPFGLSNFTGSTSFSVGNVSSIGRDLSDELDGSQSRYYGNLIETSAAINPGNSGGPLFNIDGEVIGIVSAIETRSGVNEGVGFAIPISQRTLRIIEKLASGEEVRYGYLGVQIAESDAKRFHRVRDRHVRGARVDAVIRGGPADRAGLRGDDIIVSFDGEPIESRDHLVRVIGGVLPRTEIDIRYVRNGRQQRTRATVDDRQVAMGGVRPEAPMTNWRGAEFAELTDELKRRYGVRDAEVGLVVLDVHPASDAAKHGLEHGQVVMAVNGERVKTIEEFRKAYSLATDTIRLRLDNEQVIQFSRN